MPNDPANRAAKLLSSLSVDAQSKVPALTKERVEAALQAGREDREREERAARPARSIPRVRFT